MAAITGVVAAIICLMRQLITRLDDELHALLKTRAREEGRSVNSLVVDALIAVTSQDDIAPGAAIRVGAARAGLLVVPRRPGKIPSRRTVARATQGAGVSASEALKEDRAAR